MHCLEKEGRIKNWRYQFTIEDIHKENLQLNLHAIPKNVTRSYQNCS